MALQLRHALLAGKVIVGSTQVLTSRAGWVRKGLGAGHGREWLPLGRGHMRPAALTRHLGGYIRETRSALCPRNASCDLSPT